MGRVWVDKVACTYRANGNTGTAVPDQAFLFVEFFLDTIFFRQTCAVRIGVVRSESSWSVEYFSCS